jgi:hypothetical protein
MNRAMKMNLHVYKDTNMKRNMIMNTDMDTVMNVEMEMHMHTVTGYTVNKNIGHLYEHEHGC